MDVYRTPATELDDLVISSLQPPAEFVGTARRALGALGAALRERGGLRDAAAPTWRVLKIAKGGSSGRGTALRGGCDSELVIFLDCFKSYKDQRLRRPEILKEMQALLNSWCQQKVPGLSLEFPQQDTSGVLQFRLKSTDLENWMDVSLVPAFDALGEGCLAHSRVGGKIMKSKTGLPVQVLPTTGCVTWVTHSGLQFLNQTLYLDQTRAKKAQLFLDLWSWSQDAWLSLKQLE